jgi:CRP-like cAMP-binding protein
MSSGELGTVYRDGETIVRQGEPGTCMYVVQEGEVEVLASKGDGEIRLAVLGLGDVFGEMALFSKEARSATVRAVGNARVLRVDKQTFLRRVHEDPSLAFRLLQKMAERIRALDQAFVRLAS